MNASRSIIFSVLLLCWALLLSAQSLGAAMYASGQGHSYEAGLEHIGPVIPVCAWFCFGAALAVLISAIIPKKADKIV